MKFLLSATIILASPLIAAPVPLLRTAATVNGKMITTREVEQQLAPTVSMLLAKYPRGQDLFTVETPSLPSLLVPGISEDSFIRSLPDRFGPSFQLLGLILLFLGKGMDFPRLRLSLLPIDPGLDFVGE